MKCKKSIMGLAALLIVMFHFYIPFTGMKTEVAVYKAAYIGVDLFFFVSAYSLAQRKEIQYGKFLWNRVCNTYFPFVFLAILGALYSHWNLPTFLKVISGVQFFAKGGGSFLWFFVAIMLLYLIAPLMVKLKNRLQWKALPIFLGVWLLLICILQYGFKYTDIFILINRIPIFVLGMYYVDMREWDLKKFKLPIILVGFVAGAFLLYRFGSLRRLSKPIKDGYYIMAIPFILSLVALWDYCSARIKIRNLPLQFVGAFTLELYGLQMIYGFDLEMKLLKLLNKNKLGTFLLTTLILLAAAYLLHLMRTLINRLIKRIKQNMNQKKKDRGE